MFLDQKDFKLARHLLKYVKDIPPADGKELLGIALKYDAWDVVEVLKARGIVPAMQAIKRLMKA